MSDELCTPEYEDAPFCSGPSDPEGRGDIGVTQDEIDYCVEHHPGTYPDEHTGQCTVEALEYERALNGAPETETTTETGQPAPPPDTLPHTGVEANLLAAGLAMVAIGTAILRRTRA